MSMNTTDRWEEEKAFLARLVLDPFLAEEMAKADRPVNFMDERCRSVFLAIMEGQMKRVTAGFDSTRKLLEEAGETGALGCLDEIHLALNADSFGKNLMSLAGKTLPLRKTVFDMVKDIERSYEKKRPVTGIPTGFPWFDRVTGGLQASEFMIIAGRPVTVTSSFLYAAALKIARQEKPVCIMSRELSREQIVLKMLGKESGIPIWDLESGWMKRKDWPAIAQAAGQLADLPIFIDDSLENMDAIFAKARLFTGAYGINALFIDNIQLIPTSVGFTGRTAPVRTARLLKGLSREIAIPIIASCHWDNDLFSMHPFRASKLDADRIFRLEKVSPSATNKDGWELIAAEARSCI